MEAAGSAGRDPSLASTRGRRVTEGVVLALVAAVVGTIAWVLAYRAGQVVAALVAVAVGVAVGLALGRWRGGLAPALLGVVLVVAASLVGQNFAQRHELIQGIDRLQQDWETLRVRPGTAGGGTTVGKPLSDDPGCAARPSGVIPPPEILAQLPTVALLCMSAEELATVWDSIPEDKRAELPGDARRAVESALAGSTEEQLERSREAYASAKYDIPEAVLACAPPPDFTQPDAQSGLGFEGGVPLLLPRAKLFDPDRRRGDGLEVETPTPTCFARENAKEHPLEPLSWVAAAVFAFVLPFRRRPGRS